MFFEKMQTRKNDGFTLVELIVVIAILAILAGIAVPAYSGYIEKANVAADEQLLHAVNTAFLSAAAEHAGGTVTNASLNYGTSNGGVTVTGVASVASSGTADTEKLKAAFTTYYGDNNTSAFKTVSRLLFNPATSSFVISGNLTLTYNGTEITISAEDAMNLINSTYATSIGAEGLLNKVNDVAGFASALDSSASYNAVITDPDFMKTLLTTFGMTTEEVEAMDNDTLLQTYGAYVDYLAQQQITAGKATDLENGRAQVKANLAVLHAAQNTGTLGTDTINTLLNSSSPKDTIIATLNNDPGEGLAQAALFYGLYTSFANTDEYGTQTRKDATADPLTLIKGLTDSELKEFQTYVNSDQGQADLNAYLSSMDMVNSGTQGSEAAIDVLVNGYNNQELVDLLTGVMGK